MSEFRIIFQYLYLVWAVKNSPLAQKKNFSSTKVSLKILLQDLSIKRLNN